MPSWVKDEAKWKKAQEIAERQYDIGEDNPDFYRVVTGIYKKMMGGTLAKARPVQDEVTETIKISGPREAVDRVLALLSMVYLNGAWGHSGTFAIDWDGDGSDHVDIKGINFGRFKDMVEACSSYGGEVESVGGIVDGKPCGCVLTSKGWKRVYPPEEMRKAIPVLFVMAGK